MFRQIKILISFTKNNEAKRWQVNNIRLYLLKIGATIKNRVRTATIKFSKAFVHQNLLTELLLI